MSLLDDILSNVKTNLTSAGQAINSAAVGRVDDLFKGITTGAVAKIENSKVIAPPVPAATASLNAISSAAENNPGSTGIILLALVAAFFLFKGK